MRLGEQIGPQDAQHGLEHRDGHEADHDDVESAQGAADQHLVDDEGERGAGEEVPDVFQFAHARHRVADPASAEIRHR